MKIHPWKSLKLPQIRHDWQSRYVYFAFLPGDSPIVKIGSTLDPLKRFQMLRQKEGSLLDMQGLAIGSYAHERDFHLYLRDHLVPDRGREWFFVTDEILDFVQRIPSLQDFISSEDCPNMQHPAPEYFVRMYEAGVSIDNIASFFSRTRQNVYDRVNKLYETRSPPDRPAPEMSVEDIYAKIVKEHPIFTLAGE